MSLKYFLVEPRGRVALVTINNPPWNFLRMGMMFELNDLLDAFERDGVRALVITGGVKDYFIAHADLERVVLPASASNPKAYQFIRYWHDTLWRLQTCPQVVIAAINGQALGGGCMFALACDFRFMARGPKKIGLIEVQLGIIPVGAIQRTARLLGRGKALELMLEGGGLSADEAERVGLVHRALDPDQLLPHSLAYAEKLAQWSPVAIRNIKRTVNEGLEMPLPQALELETACFYECMASEEARQALEARIRTYAEGREPAWE